MIALPDRRYPSDDRDLRGCDNELCVFSGENGDWYVSIVKRGEKIGPCVRVTTSGSPLGMEGVPVAIARLYRALGGEAGDPFEAIAAAGFRIAPSLHGQPTLWCKECGRDSGLHWSSCSKWGAR